MTLRHESPAPGSTVREAVPQMLRPSTRPLAGAVNSDLGTFLASVRTARRSALGELRNRAVAGKGRGAPVLFDVAACYGTLRADLDRRALAPPPDSGALSAVLTDVAMNQDRATWRIGAEVLDRVNRLREWIAPDEDVTTATQLVTDLVNEAQTLGILSTPDVRERLAEASAAVAPTAMELYRRFAKAGAAVRPEDVWDLIDDPRPKLQVLLDFATLAQRVFTNVEQYLAGQAADGETVDLATVAQELRGLADTLDQVQEGTR